MLGIVPNMTQSHYTSDLNLQPSEHILAANIGHDHWSGKIPEIYL